MFRSIISYEPPYIAHVTSIVSVSIMVHKLINEATCLVTLGYDVEMCNEIIQLHQKNKSTQAIELENLTGQIFVLKNMLENVFPVLYILSIGNWMDKYGVRFPLLSVTAAFSIHHLLFLGLILLPGMKISVDGWTLAVLTTMVVSMWGSEQCFEIAGDTYVSKSVPIHDLSLRMGISRTSAIFGLFCGYTISSFFMTRDPTGGNIFALALCLELFALVYLYFSIQNDPETAQNVSFMEKIKDFFDPGNPKETIMCIQRPNDPSQKRNIYLLLFQYVLAYGPMSGESVMIYLFLHNRVGYEDASVANYFCFVTIVALVLNFFATITIHHLQLSDSVSGIVGSLSFFLRSLAVFMTTPKTTYLLWIAPFLACMSGVLFSLPRTMIIKLMDNKNVGKINSVFEVLGCLIPLLFYPIYFVVFENFPNGTHYFVSAACMIISLAVYGWLFKYDYDPTTDSKRL